MQPGVRGPVPTMRQQSGGNDDDRTVNAALLLATAGVGAAPTSLSPRLRWKILSLLLDMKKFISLSLYIFFGIPELKCSF